MNKADGPKRKRTTKQKPLRFKIIRPVYETLTVNDEAAEYFEPLETISSSSHVARLFGFLGRETREHFWTGHLDSKNRMLCLNQVSTGSLLSLNRAVN